MLKRLRKAHPILFCVLAEVVFLASLFVTDLVFTIALVLFRTDFASIDTYLYSTLQELVGAMVAVLFLVRTDRAGLLRRRGSGFFNGLLVGMYPLVFIGYNAFGSLVLGRPENGVLQPAARICTFLVSMAMVGVAEEFIFRGVIAQTLLEHFGTSRAGVWKACLLSGVLFGAAHLTNILSSAPFGVLMQCVFAASLGTLFAAIYFRTGNLWVTVFLHGAMDISSMLIGGLYGTTTVADAVSGYDASMLLSVLLYLIPTAVLLRKKKLPEVQLYWHQYVKNKGRMQKISLHFAQGSGILYLLPWYGVGSMPAFWECRFPPLFHWHIKFYKEVCNYEQAGSYGQSRSDREGHWLSRSAGCSADRSHQRAERAPEEEPERSPQPPRPDEDGWPPPQSAGLSPEEGHRALPCSDRNSGSA